MTENNNTTITPMTAVLFLLMVTMSAAMEASNDDKYSQQQHYRSTTTSAAVAFGNGMSFQQCYVGCFLLCAIQPTETLSSCGFQCFRDCLLPPPNKSQIVKATTTTASSVSDDKNKKNVVNILKSNDSLYFCNLGCASTQCSNISSLNNPRGKEVAGCVRTCAGVCRKNYLQYHNINFNTVKEDKTTAAVAVAASP